MASSLARIFRAQSDSLAIADGWGTVRSPMLRGVREEAKATRPPSHRRGGPIEDRGRTDRW